LTVSYSLLEPHYFGFEPIGDINNEFTGELDGQGYEINGLTIDRPDEDDVGLFGYTDDSKINNVSVVDVDIIGSESVGALIGWDTGDVRESYMTGDVHGNGNFVGGLIGENRGKISKSYANGNVSGDNQVGGLVGENSFGASIKESYSNSSVLINEGSSVGGLVGDNLESDSVTDSYWDTEASGQDSDSSDGAVGLTTSEMTGADAETNMSGFDFENTWVTVDSDYPELRVFE